MLSDVKPPVFDIRSKTELHKFISENFETERTEGKNISVKKLANLFSEPSVTDAKYWLKILRKILDDTSKL
jgi:hypothetical protein